MARDYVLQGFFAVFLRICRQQSGTAACPVLRCKLCGPACGLESTLICHLCACLWSTCRIRYFGFLGIL